MKIAMFTDSYYPRINGVTVSVHSFAEELSKLGHQVSIVCLEYTEEQQKSTFFDENADEVLPFSVIRIPSTRLAFSKEDRAARIDKWLFVKHAMDKFKPEIIHINSEWLVGYYGAIYSRHRHIPFVFTFHTLWEEYLANYLPHFPRIGTRKIGREVVRFYLKRANLIIAPTKRIAEVVKDYGIDREVHILPTGIPSSKLAFSEKQYNIIRDFLYRKFPVLRDSRILLFVGRIVKEKNPDFLFDVLKKVRERVSNTVLLFVGGGPYLEELRKKSQDAGLVDSVFFTGYIDGSKLIYFYKVADVFTFPSKTETQGLVTIEAMLAGLPVVAIGEMGTLDVMQGDHGGFMVGDEIGEFSDHVVRLLEDETLRKEKSAEAEEWASKWKISNLTPKLAECYEKAAANYKNRD